MSGVDFDQVYLSFFLLQLTFIWMKRILHLVLTENMIVKPLYKKKTDAGKTPTPPPPIMAK